LSCPSSLYMVIFIECSFPIHCCNVKIWRWYNNDLVLQSISIIAANQPTLVIGNSSLMLQCSVQWPEHWYASSFVIEYFIFSHSSTTFHQSHLPSNQFSCFPLPFSGLANSTQELWQDHASLSNESTALSPCSSACPLCGHFLSGVSSFFLRHVSARRVLLYIGPGA
jgi:hypothetical protein